MVVITYCVEYAESQRSVCLSCNKIIPNKSLRMGRMERQSEKQKKKFAKFTWYHFKCFEVPEVLTRIPVHMIRGQVNLLDKDKLRLERVLKMGVGGSWSQIVEQHKKRPRGEGDDDDLGDLVDDDEKDGDQGKNTNANMDEDDDDGTGSKAKDFTAQLTGQTDRKHKPNKYNNNKNLLKPNTKGAKIEKPQGKNSKPSSSSSKQTGPAGKSKNGPPAAAVGARKTGSGKPMSAVEKAIAATRAGSKKKLEQMQAKFGKK